MKTFFFKYGRFFLLAFALGFLMPRLQSVSLEANSFDYNGSANLDDLIVGYHLQMNAITNEYIERLMTSEDPNVLYPSDADSCNADNLSTFCLANELNENLIAFETELVARKDGLENLSGSLEEALSQANQQELVIQEQRQNAEDALDLTLAIYNQIQTVYPLHKEMENFRDGLESFRDQLALLRDVIEIYPSKFNGATTAHCK